MNDRIRSVLRHFGMLAIACAGAAVLAASARDVGDRRATAAPARDPIICAGPCRPVDAFQDARGHVVSVHVCGDRFVVMRDDGPGVRH